MAQNRDGKPAFQIHFDLVRIETSYQSDKNGSVEQRETHYLPLLHDGIKSLVLDMKAINAPEKRHGRLVRSLAVPLPGMRQYLLATFRLVKAQYFDFGHGHGRLVCT